MNHTILVIGGGPGGYVAAIRAAQLGATVHLIEEKQLGGTCLNVGCIPTKSLLHAASTYQQVKAAAKSGVMTDGIALDWTKIQKNKDSVVKKLVRGVSGLLTANGVTVHTARATLKDSRTVTLDNGETLTGDSILLATGSTPAVIPFPGHDLPGVIDSTGALALTELPKSLCILGGGVIGCEFAELFASLGVTVTVVEMLPEILPPIDGEIAGIVRGNLSAKGVAIHTGAKLDHVEQSGEKLTAIADKAGEALRIECEKLLVAVGRRANTKNLGLEEIGVVLNRDAIEVNEHFETSVPGIYAIGDCNGKLMLAHAASAQGEAAVAHCLGKVGGYDGKIVPSCVYTDPEVASVGLTEELAKALGVSYHIGRFPLAGNGKSMIEGCTNGLIKFLVAEDGGILGAHMIGPRVTDMIAEIALAMHMGAKVQDIAETIHAHPTVSEAVAEAALDADGMSIHWPPKKA